MGWPRRMASLAAVRRHASLTAQRPGNITGCFLIGTDEIACRKRNRKNLNKEIACLSG